MHEDFTFQLQVKTNLIKPYQIGNNKIVQFQYITVKSSVSIYNS